MTATPGPPNEQWVEFDTTDGEHWRVDVGFLGSEWTCIWGAGCRGIGPEADPTHIMGCCSLGAEFANPDDAMNVAAHAAFLDPERFQFHEVAERDGIFADDSRRATRVVDGGCIFLNRADFEGGAGCALHQAALADDEPPRDWKPIVCWQLPFRIDVVEAEQQGTPVHVLRRWAREDFDEERSVSRPDGGGPNLSGAIESVGVDEERSVSRPDGGLPGLSGVIESVGVDEERSVSRPDGGGPNLSGAIGSMGGDEDGDSAASIPWLCTDDPAAYVAEVSAVARNRDDLVELVGEEAVTEIDRRL